MVDYVTSDDGKGIYAYIDVETLEPVYIGQTKQSFRERDNQHRYNLNDYCPFDKKLKNDQSKYVLIPIIYSDNPDTLNLMESYYIYAFDTIEKENRTWGGEIGLSGKNHPQYRHDIDEDDVERLYFDEKLSLRGKTYNMVSVDEYHKLVSSNEEMSGNNVIGKMFGHFFGN